MRAEILGDLREMNEYFSLDYTCKSLSQENAICIRSGLSSCGMLTLQGYHSLIFGGKSGQSSISKFSSGFDPPPTTGFIAGKKKTHPSPFNASPCFVSTAASNGVSNKQTTNRQTLTLCLV